MSLESVSYESKLYYPVHTVFSAEPYYPPESTIDFYGHIPGLTNGTENQFANPYDGYDILSTKSYTYAVWRYETKVYRADGSYWYSYGAPVSSLESPWTSTVGLSTPSKPSGYPNTQVNSNGETYVTDAYIESGYPQTNTIAITVNYYKNQSTTNSINLDKPTYIDFTKGYALDNRLIPNSPVIKSNINKTIDIGYYRVNKLESIPDLTTIDWLTYRCELRANINYTLPIVDWVMGTLYCPDTDIASKIKAIPPIANKYPFKYLFLDELPEVFDHWTTLYNSAIPVLPSPPSNATSVTVITEYERKLVTLGANNDVWNNRPISTPDTNVNTNHPMCTVNNQRAYDWYITPQINGSIGSLIMDSPRTIEIHKALDAGNYAINNLDTTKKRINNLGWLIENTARVNGLRFDANGDIDLIKEKEFYQPRTIANPSLGLPSASGKYNSYGMSCFGTIGMIIPHLPTTYGANGKEQKLFDIVHDNQQLALAILRQQDTSLSIQHGSEIRINGLDGKVHAYPNQLAVSLECLQRLEKISYQTDKNLLISTVAGTEIRELFSGIGIPVTQKFIPLKDPLNSNKTLSLPYFGHQKNKLSIAQSLTTVQINLAVINGVLMPKKQPAKSEVHNPFKLFTIKK